MDSGIEQPEAEQPAAAPRVPEPIGPVDYEATPPLLLDPDLPWADRKAAIKAFLPSNFDALTEAYNGPQGAPNDPQWLTVRATPDFPWGGPYAAKPPAEPPAVAPHLPLPVEQLPAGLQPIADRIESFWLGKGGARSEAAFRALIEELQLVLPAAGRSGVVELLRHAAQAGWPAINARAWLNQRSREPDLHNHPAYRTFRAA
jgi:hypothetical protein